MIKPAMMIGHLAVVLALIAILIGACKSPEAPVREIRAYSLDSLQGVIEKSNVKLDKKVSADAGGSLKIVSSGPVTVRLFETGDIDVENARLLYQAKVSTKNLTGQVYLEMWCHFQGKRAFFSRGLDRPVTTDVEWTSLETSFFLKKGENPDNVSLNLVIQGKGIVWIDDIKLQASPLQ